MTAIPPLGPSAVPQAHPVSTPLPAQGSPPARQDAFCFGTSPGPAGADPLKSFWRESKAMADRLAAQAGLGTPEAVLTEKSAGWKTHLFSPQGCGCYVKVPLDGEATLVLPVGNSSGGAFGRPVVVDPGGGIVGVPDVDPGSNPMCVRGERSPDGERVYLRSGGSTRVRVYDRTLATGQEIDLGALDPDFGSIRDFRSGRQVDVAFMADKNRTSDRGFVVGLDPKTHQPVFRTRVDTLLSWDLYEDPQGNFYIPLDKRGDGGSSTHTLRVFSPAGKALGSLATPGTAQDLVFRDDGLLVFNQGRAGVRAVVASGTGGFTEKWAIADKSYRHFQLSADGRFVYGVDPCEGFSRSHVLVKIDAETGQVVWKREAYGEQFADMRVVGDDLYLLTTGVGGASRDVTHMRRFDANNTCTWEDTQKLGEMDEYPEGMRGSITAQGNFIFGGRSSGDLYALHPRQAGETEQGIRDAIDRSGDVVADSQRRLETSLEEAQASAPAAPTLEVHEGFIVVNGVRLERRAE